MSAKWRDEGGIKYFSAGAKHFSLKSKWEKII
jgi:hypothetical protein